MATLNYLGNGQATLTFSMPEREVVEESPEALQAYLTLWLAERFKQFMNERFEKMPDADRVTVVQALKDGAAKGRP